MTANVWSGTAVFTKDGEEHEALVFNGKIPDRVFFHLAETKFLLPGEPVPAQWGIIPDQVVPVTFVPEEATA